MSKIAKAAQIMKHELIEVLPVAIFFLVGLNMIALSKHLVLLKEGIYYEGAAEATIGALIIAKVFLIVDKLPAMRINRDGPLYRVILYRAVFYSLSVMAFHEIEALVSNMLKVGDLANGVATTRAEFVWEHFVFVLMWVFVLFLVYVTLAELRDEIGRGRLRKILFSRGKP